jgi:parvulin-like peptidyl-prolyl isomerase
MKRVVLLILVSVLLVTSCTIMSNNDMAIIGGNKISLDELYKYIPPANFEALSNEDKALQIDKVCDDYLARYYLEDHGDLDSGDVMWEIRTWEIRELANGAYQHLVVDHILTPSALRKLYDKMKYELDVSHILIAYNNTKKLNNRTKEEARALIDELSLKVNDDNFEELVMKYSDDGSKERNMGHLGWATAGHWVDEFEDAAYKLEPGEYSEPIETAFGFHIIKLNERKEVSLEPFEQVRDELIDFAFDNWRAKFILRETAVFDSLMTANPLVLNDSLLLDFLDRFSRLSKNVFYSEQFTAYDILNIFSDTLTVGYLGDTPIDKTWITQFLKMISLQLPPRFTDRASFEGFLEQNRKGSILYTAALNIGLDKSPEFTKTRNVFLAKKSSGLFDKLYVFEQISPSPEKLKDFYETYKNDLYATPEKATVREVLLKDSTLAVEIYNRVLKGESIEDLASEYSERNVGRKNKGIIPAFKKNQYGEMSIAAFNMLDGEIAGPFKLGDYYSVIQRVALIPAGYRDYEQVKYRILTDYRNQYMSQKRIEQKAMLRKMYNVRINPSLLK